MTPETARDYAAWTEALLAGLARCPLRRWWRPASRRREAVVLHALDAARDRPGQVLEFGVYQGRSLRALARRAPRRRFAGFDSFAGFPEDGRSDWDLDFSVIAPPEMPANVTLVPGWFSDTVPGFLREHPGPVAMVHIDCDLYSSTRDVLAALADSGHLSPGLVIALDEGINYDGFPWNEMLALYEALRPRGLGLKPLAVHGRVRSLADTLTLVEAGRHPDWRSDQAAGYRQQAAVVVTEGEEAPEAGAALDETAARLLRLTRGRSGGAV